MNFFRNKPIPLLLILLVIILGGCSGSQQAEKELRPNILFIPVDDLRPDIGAFGDTTAITPNIDRLAAEGLIFTRAYCQQAVCNPSRASLLTGLRPDSLRVWDLRTNFRHKVPEAVTLPQYFKNNGYHTVGIGKIFHNTIPDTVSWTEKPHIEGFPFDPDAVYLTAENIRKVEEKKQSYIEQGIDRIDQLGHWYIKTVATEVADVDDDAYFDGAQTTLAIQKLREFSEMDKPFFLAVGYYRPHLPFNAPKKYWDLYDRESIPVVGEQSLPADSPPYAMNISHELRGYDDFKDLPLPGEGPLSHERQQMLKHGYYASVSYVDAQVGRLLDELERLDLAANTIIVLWGDHGWKLGEYNAWCKQTNYEIDTRVPMIFSGPGVSSAGKACNALTEFVDIYPTLCELAGLEVPEYLQGKSVVPLLEDPGRPWANAARSQFLRGRFGKEKEVFAGREFMGYALRTDRYRYVEWYEWDREKEAKGAFLSSELYDHSTDPSELINIAAGGAAKAVTDSLSVMLWQDW
jgi:arylsulfatase A-like enzyme